jgi:hypothetical protein
MFFFAAETVKMLHWLIEFLHSGIKDIQNLILPFYAEVAMVDVVGVIGREEIILG